MTNEHENNESPERAKILHASHILEELSMIGKQMVGDLRDGKPNAYGRVYWLRKQLSYVVAHLGAGVPSGLKEIEAEYEKWIGRNT